MIFYAKNSKDSTKNCCNNQSQILYNDNKQSENEVNYSIYNSIKKNKMLRNKLNQEMKDLYTGSCVTLLKKMKRDKNKWKGMLFSWIGTLNIVNMTILPKAIYRFNANSTKTPMAVFAEIEKLILKIIQKLKGSQIAKTIQQMRNKAGGLIYPEFKKTYYNTTVKSMVLASRPMEQNRELRNKPSHV